MDYDYTTIGHVTVDVLADGREQPGGGAFYSALQAAALGLRALIVTRGEPREIERLLDPFASRLEVIVQRAPSTTRLETSGDGIDRRQRVLAWAGPLEPVGELSTEICHLAPVVREVAAPCPRGGRFRAATPQGLVRRWDREGVIEACAMSAADALLGDSLDAAVLNARERPLCDALVARALAGGAVIAVTDEGDANVIAHGGREEFVVPEPLAVARQDIGAGDVYAAAFFIALAGGAAPVESARRANRAAHGRMSSSDPSTVISALEAS